MTPRILVCVATLGFLCGVGRANINIPSDGSDGAFNPTASVELDLSQAATGQWDAPNSANIGKGIYDSSKWAVVFKYSSVNIPAGVTVTFKNHPANPPVVWLVQGDVTIDGKVSVSAPASVSGILPSVPGPGGYRGGWGGTSWSAPSSGFGPGGGAAPGFSGNYANYENAYGNAQVMPLVGGSGGGASFCCGSGDAGGGAIMIACGGVLHIGAASLEANGINYGTGGGVRLVADSIEGNGTVSASSDGRIRLEVNDMSKFVGNFIPAASISASGDHPLIWPPATAPSVHIISVAGIAVGPDPLARLSVGEEDITLPNLHGVIVRIATQNVPNGDGWRVYIRAVGRTGRAPLVKNATWVSGDMASSIYEVDLDTLTVSGFTVLQARAVKGN